MSARREPSEPPIIPGYQPGRLLGMGGFADVFLYTQQMPRRSVAVKVLLASSLSEDVRERFRAEADLMATLSHHPSIVTVFQADVAADGRPYLVMEYCSRPGLGKRYRTERMGVPEVLRIGIRLASAVETAHRAGILHRDIKPANVLVTDFGWPALTDFGIAATTGWSTGSAIGMSIPWSPPELLAEAPHGDVRSDVYSLAATVYSLLAGRSPFEVTDGSNTAGDLIARIERATLTSTGRADAPPGLQDALARAMDRVPERRYHSALAFARALQQVEAQLALPTTPLDLPDEVDLHRAPGEPGSWPGSADDDPADHGQATRLRPVTAVAPDAPGPAAPAPPAPPPADAVDPAASAPLPEYAEGVPESWRRGEREPAEAAGASGRQMRIVTGSVAAAVVLAAVGIGAVYAFGPKETPEEEVVATTPAPLPVRPVPTPVDLIGEIMDGTAVFTWTNPDPQEGDRYLWGTVELGEAAELELVDSPTVAVPAAGDQVCIEVAVVRADGRYSTSPAVGCAQA